MDNRMPRELKFRGKRVDNGEWVYGWYIQRYDTIFGQKDVMKHIIDAIVPSRVGAVIVSLKVIPETVGQYTGMHDKNGKEVYEKDICKNDGGMIGEVVFHDYSWMFKWRSGNYYPLGQWVEVIGNIHDNPSLLEVPPCQTN
ncbi:MAG: YopX family protein [Desulfosporosinus sp.]